MRMMRALFVNGGILGLASFHNFLSETLPRQRAIEGTQVMLTDNLSALDRVIRRALCQRLWVDGTLGLRNIDLARFRQELHTGVLARRRIATLGAARFDVLHFHRQATAYGSLDLMRTTPSVISIDCTQDGVLQEATSSAERASYGPNIRMDGVIFARAAAVIATSRWAKDSARHPCTCCRTPCSWSISIAAGLRSAGSEAGRARGPDCCSSEETSFEREGRICWTPGRPAACMSPPRWRSSRTGHSRDRFPRG
jgi:hypothetical protein